MNKKELVAKSAVMANLTKADMERALYALCETIASELHDGGQVRIGGFGIFGVKERKARKGINPQTGEEIDVPGRNVQGQYAFERTAEFIGGIYHDEL